MTNIGYYAHTSCQPSQVAVLSEVPCTSLLIRVGTTRLSDSKQSL